MTWWVFAVVAWFYDLIIIHEPERSTVIGPSICWCVDEGRDILLKLMVYLCAMEGLKYLNQVLVTKMTKPHLNYLWTTGEGSRLKSQILQGILAHHNRAADQVGRKINHLVTNDIPSERKLPLVWGIPSWPLLISQHPHDVGTMSAASARQGWLKLPPGR
jgi:hypothetical protein